MILRGRHHGLEALVAVAAPSNADSVRFARQLDAIVLTTPVETRAIDSSREALATCARENGFDGLILAGTADTTVDFDRSLAAIEDGTTYTVEAIEQRSGKSGDVVGIPAYNEAETIGDVVSGALAVADSVLVVDDGSTDETANRADAAGADVVSHATNRGYGAALKTLFSTADAWNVSELVVIDADGQHDTGDIPALRRQRAEHGYDIVIGSRFTDESDGNVPPLRRVGISVVNVLSNFLLYSTPSRSWVTDAQSGFRVYGRSAITTLSNTHRIGDSMSSSTDILFVAASKGLEIGEVGITVEYDVADPNTKNPIAHGMALVRNVVRIVEIEYPIKLLGVPGLLVLFGGLGFGYWTTLNYIQTGTFPIGLSITATLFTLIGIFTFFTAIILHSLRNHYRSITR
jgi:glycosyltransferase involved in cell wall biosynthesis